MVSCDFVLLSESRSLCVTVSAMVDRERHISISSLPCYGYVRLCSLPAGCLVLWLCGILQSPNQLVFSASPGKQRPFGVPVLGSTAVISRSKDTECAAPYTVAEFTAVKQVL